jgi:hypothetical protein
MSTMRVEHAHSLALGPARERVKALGDYLNNKHKIGVRWTDDDHAIISGKYVMFSFEGKITLEEGKVVLEGPDPGMLLRGKAKDYLERKLKMYLDPATPVESLPTR